MPHKGLELKAFAARNPLSIVKRLVAAVIAVVATALIPTQSSAQDLFSFLWDGGSREVIPFSSKYTPGQIIVSFGDRRLYWIHRKGEAISYPIAVPREQSRWAGVTSVSHKAVNPSWTPTPTMLKENPRLPRWVPGGHPMDPVGSPRPLSRSIGLPHPRHRRAVDHRHGGVQGLHPHV